MAVFHIRGIVRSRGKTIAVGDNGRFETDNPQIIIKLERLGFKRIEPVKEDPEPEKVIKPKATRKKSTTQKTTKPKKVKE